MIKQISLIIATMLLFGFVGISHQVGWTEWFDRDNPSGIGDWENLSLLSKDNPGKICANPTGVEASTLSGLSVEEVGENIFKYDTTSGFVCRKGINLIGSAMIMKFALAVQLMPVKMFLNAFYAVCWTKWYNRDRPGGSGDWEHLTALRRENPGGNHCADPVYIEAVTVDGEIPSLKTGQKFHIYSPGKGFVCRNRDQRFGLCRNYKVRFGCYCRFVVYFIK